MLLFLANIESVNDEIRKEKLLREEEFSKLIMIITITINTIVIIIIIINNILNKKI